MAVVQTNDTSFQAAEETTLGVLPASPAWFTLEPNSVGSFGPNVTTTPRNPISKDRQQRKGTPTNLESAAAFNGDFTLHHFDLFAPGFIYALPDTTVQARVRSGALFQSLIAATATTLTHSALTTALPEHSLIYNRGFTTAANNGLKVVGSGSTTTTTVTTGLTAESPGNTDNATMDTAGVQEGAAGELSWTFATKTLTRSGTMPLWTALGLSVGQQICIGGPATGTTARFDEGVAVGDIVSISANDLVLENLRHHLDGSSSAATLINTDGTASTGAERIQVLFGRFLRNVSVDDSKFVRKSYQIEAAWANLQNPTGTGDEYEYSKGNRPNTMVVNLPENDKSTIDFGFVGTDTEVPTTTRKTNAATPVRVVDQVAYNGVSDLLGLTVQQVDETGLTTCIKSLTLTLDNQVTPENCLGTLGATDLNIGNFLVTLSLEAQFTDSRVVSAIRNNTTLEFGLTMKNEDGAVAFRIPSMTVADGTRDLPLNETVKISVTGTAFGDATLGYSLGMSLFPVFPLT